LAGALMVLSVHAYYILKGRHQAVSYKAFKIGLAIATVFSLTQLFSGHRSADIVAEYQPAKLAAMEGHYSEKGPADLYLFGWVDNKNQKVSGLAVPGGLSFLVHQDFSAEIQGLNAFDEKDRPKQVNAVFQFYHIMISIGMLLIFITLYASWLYWRGKLFETKWLLQIFSFSVLLPQIANQAGWFAAEMGRQPWIVYGHLRTSEGFSQEVSAQQVLFSLILFGFVYLLLFVLFLYSLHKKIKHGPEDFDKMAV
jgi:cytochrome d ubiquinol oxidase subunit I